MTVVHKDMLGTEIKLGDYAIHRAGGRHSCWSKGIITKLTTKGANIGRGWKDEKKGTWSGGSNHSADNLVVVTAQMIENNGQEWYDKALADCQEIIDQNTELAKKPVKPKAPSYKIQVGKINGEYHLLVLGFADRTSISRCEDWINSGIKFDGYRNPTINRNGGYNGYGSEIRSYRSYSSQSTEAPKYVGHKYLLSDNYYSKGNAFLGARTVKEFHLPTVKAGQYHIEKVSEDQLKQLMLDNCVASGSRHNDYENLAPTIDTYVSKTPLK